MDISELEPPQQTQHPCLERAEGRGTLETGNNKQPHLRSKLSLDYNWSGEQLANADYFKIESEAWLIAACNIIPEEGVLIDSHFNYYCHCG